jgi:anaphase-promoting complex subunit 5
MHFLAGHRRSRPRSLRQLSATLSTINSKRAPAHVVELSDFKNSWDSPENGPFLGIMTRYLTPWRISLLCLITVYTDGLVPNSSAIDVLSFLTAGLFPLDPADKQWEKHYLPRITEIEEVLSGHESSVPGRSLWDLFLKKIWSLNSLDALEVFFNDDLPSLLTKTREQLIQDRDNGLAPENEGMRLSRSSPLGAFVRRAYLEYTRLQFHDSVTLWSGFVKYRLPTYNMWARRNASDKHSPVDVNLQLHGFNSSAHLTHVVYGDIEDDEEDEGLVSVKDAERLIEFQIGELQRTSLVFFESAFLLDTDGM